MIYFYLLIFVFGATGSVIALFAMLFPLIVVIIQRGFNNKYLITHYDLIIFCTACSYLILIFGLGLDRLLHPNPIGLFISIVMFLCFIFLVSPLKKRIKPDKLLHYLVLGMASEALLISVYSYIMGAPGYGALVSPFNEGTSNSPSVSNTLAIFAIYSISNIIIGKYRALYFASVLITILLAFYLAGRTFFIVLFLYFLFLNFYPERRIKLIGFASSVSGILVFAALLSSNLYIIERFNEGFEFGRSLLWADAIIQLIQGHWYLELEYSISETFWYHNIIFDSIRTSGLVSVLPLFWLFGLAIVWALKRAKHPASFFPVQSLLFATLLILQQDVIIEGNNIMFLLFCAALFVVSYANRRFRLKPS